jgi:hypothetical protein
MLAWRGTIWRGSNAGAAVTLVRQQRSKFLLGTWPGGTEHVIVATPR